MKWTKIILLSLSILACFVVEVSAGERLARVFGDNMVLQREKSVPIWGWADKGQSITVKFANQEKKTTAGADGRWMVSLDPMPANKTPAELVVIGKTTLVLKNVLVGEVWIASGQSNMEMELSATMAMGFKPKQVMEDHPLLRHLKIMNESASFPAEDLPHGDWQYARADYYSIEPLSVPDTQNWTECSTKTCGSFSAVGYYFAIGLIEALDVPVGIINATWGGTKIEQWISADGFRAVPELKALSTKIDCHVSSTEEGNKRHKEYVEALKKWIPEAEKALAANTRLPPPVPTPWLSANPRQWLKPTTIYNGMIHPLSPYAVRGFIWYQGEGNGAENETYFQKMRALIGDWRHLWKQEDLGFYFVQLPGYQNSQDNPKGGDGWAGTREAQLKVSQKISGTGMAVAIDVGDIKTIHPGNKYDVGSRLAISTLAGVYGKNMTASGPIYNSMKVEGDKIRISFAHSGKGLYVGVKKSVEPPRELPDGKLKWISISGQDQKWHWADSQIDGTDMLVSSPTVKNPVAVRFGFTANPVPESVWLYNKEGLPASPFRTDTWPER